MPTPAAAISTTAAKPLSTKQAPAAPLENRNAKALPQPQSNEAGRLSPLTGAVGKAVTGAVAAIAQWVAEKRQRQAWLISGDPIWVKEAQAWFAAQVEKRHML